MQKILKYILITLFCIATIKSECPSGSDIIKSVCEEDTTCKWEQSAAGSCSGENNCGANTDSESCKTPCTWNEAKGTCSAKTCADYTTEPTCSAVSTCEWKNNACSTKTATEKACTEYTSEPTCSAVSTCEWKNNACSTKTATEKACTEYTSEPTCSAVSTCEWKNNACSTKTDTTTTPTTDDDEDDSVFRLKSSILIFLIFFLL